MTYTLRPEDVVGTCEVADVLGVSKQRIHALRKDKRFPEPFKVLASSPLWDKREIDNFLRQWRPWKAEQNQTGITTNETK